MPINMQGSWTVSVKSKEAAYAQRFVISGAASGNGTYAGVVTTSPVYVTGESWVISIQNNPGTGFVDSDVRIKFPTVSTGQYRFDIESNDAWTGDQDFNDLILTCSTPKTATDFLLYGNVSYYSGLCFINPCSPLRWVVIDSRPALAQALTNPVLRIPIERFYPDLVRPEPAIVGPWPPGPGPWPPPPPPVFRPIVIPLDENFALPPKQAQILRVQESTLRPARAKSRTESSEEVTTQTVVETRSFTIASPLAVRFDFDRIATAGMIDKYRSACQTGPLAGVTLRFREYDRTNAELNGGPYTGEGNREYLGACTTDRNGNYIFRFSRSIEQILEESHVDVALGENELTQVQPDIIVQLLDPMAMTGFVYESAPYWNIPLMKRINVCVPRENLGRLPTACQGGRAIQGIGSISLGEGINNVFDADGRITVGNTSGGAPSARCAAWWQTLQLHACFYDQTTVKYYTISYRRRLSNGSWGSVNYYQEELRHNIVGKAHPEDYKGDLVGPLPDVTVISNPVYLDILNDKTQDWESFNNDLKAVINTPWYTPEPGPVEFHIEGYTEAGIKVPAADDRRTLFIDNSSPVYQVNDVTMNGQAGGDCAQFTLPPGQLDAPLTVRFKANQMQGFMESYRVYVRKGNKPGDFGISSDPTGAISGNFERGNGNFICDFRGTFDDPSHPGYGVVTVNITPASDGWLVTTDPTDPTNPSKNQQFCTFAVNLDCWTRVTTGNNYPDWYYGPTQYLFAIQR